MPTYTTVAGLPPQYTTDIAADDSGFVRIGGVCVGRAITERDRVFYEVKDRNAERSLGRGAQLIRVDVDELIRFLESLKKV